MPVIAIVVAAAVAAGGDNDNHIESDDSWQVELPARSGQVRRESRGGTSKSMTPGEAAVPRLSRSIKADGDAANYVLPAAVTEIYRARGFEVPRFGAPPAHVAEDAELGRGFAGNIRAKLEALQRHEGIERRGIGETPAESQTRQRPQRERTAGENAYARLHDLRGPQLMLELNRIGLEIMERYPVGTPVGILRRAYSELVQFISERTGVSVTRIYRVMDLESYGGQYWAHHPGGASGLVQVRPIALAEMQRLRPGEFNAVDYSDVRFNPALNLYTGMSYAQEKHQDWNHYSGGARGYADYVLRGVPKGTSVQRPARGMLALMGVPNDDKRGAVSLQFPDRLRYNHTIRFERRQSTNNSQAMDQVIEALSWCLAYETRCQLILARVHGTIARISDGSANLENFLS